jgi:hypothetical protein
MYYISQFQSVIWVAGDGSPREMRVLFKLLGSEECLRLEKIANLKKAVFNFFSLHD